MNDCALFALVDVSLKLFVLLNKCPCYFLEGRESHLPIVSQPFTTCLLGECCHLSLYLSTYSYKGFAHAFVWRSNEVQKDFGSFKI